MNQKVASQLDLISTVEQATKIMDELSTLLASDSWLHLLKPFWPRLEELAPLGEYVESRLIIEFFQDEVMPKILSMLPDPFLDWVAENSKGRNATLVKRFISGTKLRLGKLCLDRWMDYLEENGQTLLMTSKHQTKRVTKDYYQALEQIRSLKSELDTLERQLHRYRSDVVDLEHRLTKAKENLARTESEVVACAQLLLELAEDVKRHETEMVGSN